jgi:hypothetical protein
VTVSRGIDGSDPVRADPVERPVGLQEERRSVRTSHLASGTLACPACDAPVAPAAGPMAPSDPIECPLCSHAGAVRDFLSLAAPTRPARVEVRVVRRG